MRADLLKIVIVLSALMIGGFTGYQLGRHSSMSMVDTPSKQGLTFLPSEKGHWNCIYEKNTEL